MTAPWNTDAPLETYFRRAGYAGIEHTVVFPAFHTDYSEANRELAGIVARWHPRLIGFAMVNAKSDAGRVHEMLHEAVIRLNLKGLKIHGFEAMPTREVCEAAQEEIGDRFQFGNTREDRAETDQGVEDADLLLTFCFAWVGGHVYGDGL